MRTFLRALKVAVKVRMVIGGEFFLNFFSYEFI
jgi:hypothetical protein